MNGVALGVNRILRILGTALRDAIRHNVLETSAAISFFVIFSLFPLLALAVVVASFLFGTPEYQESILQFALKVLPSATRELVRQNLFQTLEARGAVGFFGAIGLAWSATSAFGILTGSLNKAWSQGPARNAVKTQLIGLLLMLAVLGLLLTFLTGEFTLQFLSQSPLRKLAAVRAFLANPSITNVFIFSLFGLVTLVLYRFIPTQKVKWKQAFSGAGVATILSAVCSAGFSWYLESGFSTFNLVYGSLGTLVALMAWVYLVVTSILLGSFVAARLGTPGNPAYSSSPYENPLR